MKAQEYDPVVLYWICRYLLREEAEENDPEDAFFESKRFPRNSPVARVFDNIFSKNEKSLIAEVFRNSTMHLGVWATRCGDDFEGTSLYARTEFVTWLKSIDLEFDDKMHLVTIPG